jgi:hypothetical protein
MRGETMADELVGNILVVVHNRQPPASEEWSAHCAGIVAQRAAIEGVVVIANGSGPSALQRQRLQEAWGPGTPPPIAILTRSTVVRGVLTALNWFMANKLKPFAASDFPGAFRYVKLPEAAWPDVLRVIRRLAIHLGVAIHDDHGSHRISE